MVPIRIVYFEGISREHAITKLVISHVPKAEKARRHGRELSFILPHNAVNNFAALFSAIEQEINSGGKLGKCYNNDKYILFRLLFYPVRYLELWCFNDNFRRSIFTFRKR